MPSLSTALSCQWRSNVVFGQQSVYLDVRTQPLIMNGDMDIKQFVRPTGKMLE